MNAPQPPPGPWYPPMYGGYQPMGAAQAAGRMVVRRPPELSVALAFWLLGATFSLVWLVVRTVELHAATADESGYASEFQLKWGYLFLGVGLLVVAAFALFAFLMHAGQDWARITLTALAVLVLLPVFLINSPYLYVAAGCALTGAVLGFLPRCNAYFRLTGTP